MIGRTAREAKANQESRKNRYFHRHSLQYPQSKSNITYGSYADCSIVFVTGTGGLHDVRGKTQDLILKAVPQPDLMALQKMGAVAYCLIQ